SGLARLVAAVALPAALLFRSRHRAHGGARAVLGTPLAISLPSAVHTVLGRFGPTRVATAGAAGALPGGPARLTRLLRPAPPGAGLCAGPAAFAGVALLRGPRAPAEAPLRLRHPPRLAAVAILGALLAPVALAWGLGRASGVSASLLINLEAVFTLALGAIVH